MSDRVIYGTNNDEPSAFSGFPHRVVDSASVGAGTLWPSGGALNDTLSKWWWRVKEWEVTTDLEVSDGVDSYPLQVAIASGVDNAATELDLIDPGTALKHGFSGSNADPDTVITLGLTLFEPQLFAEDDWCRKNSGLYYPNLQLGLTAIGLVNSLSMGSQTGPVDGTVAATFDGVALTLYYNLGGWTLSGSSFDITPVEYWPYAAADASPIYNTTTGAQLQSPLN